MEQATGPGPKRKRPAVSLDDLAREYGIDAGPSRASEVTPLAPDEEPRFQAWARTNKIPDVDHPDAHYDYRGFWKATGGPPVRYGVDHFPDTYKQHGHPTFSEESQYSEGTGDGGTWDGDRFVPAPQAASRRAPPRAPSASAVPSLDQLALDYGITRDTRDTGDVDLRDAAAKSPAPITLAPVVVKPTAQRVAAEQAANTFRQRTGENPAQVASDGRATVTVGRPRGIGTSAQELDRIANAPDLATRLDARLGLARGPDSGYRTAGARPVSDKIADVAATAVAAVPKAGATIGRFLGQVPDVVSEEAGRHPGFEDLADATDVAAAAGLPRAEPKEVAVSAAQLAAMGLGPLAGKLAGRVTSSAVARAISAVDPAVRYADDPAAYVGAVERMLADHGATIARGAGEAVEHGGSGALIGASFDPEHPGRGAAIGAGLGLAARGLARAGDRAARPSSVRVEEDPARLLAGNGARARATARAAPDFEVTHTNTPEEALAEQQAAGAPPTSRIAQIRQARAAAQGTRAPVAPPTPDAPLNVTPPDHLAVRVGPITKDGAYFSRTAEIDPTTPPYDLRNTKLANGGDPATVQQLAAETLKDPSLTPDQQQQVQQVAQAGRIDYQTNDDVPALRAAAQRLGYDGLQVFEADDTELPSSAFIWNIRTVQPGVVAPSTPAPASAPAPAKPAWGTGPVDPPPALADVNAALAQRRGELAAATHPDVVGELTSRVSMLEAQRRKLRGEPEPEMAGAQANRDRLARTGTLRDDVPVATSGAIPAPSGPAATLPADMLDRYRLADGRLPPWADETHPHYNADYATQKVDGLRRAERQRQFSEQAGPPSLVDAAGQPKRVYHGTRHAFGEFNEGFTDPSALYGPGFYFTEDPTVASSYTTKGRAVRSAAQIQRDIDYVARTDGLSDDARESALLGLEQEREAARHGQPFDSPNVRPAHVALQKPFDVDHAYSADETAHVFDTARAGFEVDPKQTYSGDEIYQQLVEDFQGDKQAVNETLAQSGYDGITHVGGARRGDHPHRVWIAFDSAQIRSPFRGESPSAPVSPSGAPKAPEKKEYDYSSTQLDLPPETATAIQQLGAKIPDADLAKDGRETEPHITVKYGLHGNDPEQVRALLADEPPITVKLGKTSIFPDSGSGDVVKVDVDSPALHALNKKIADALPHTDTHPEYKPHATVAYVKKGMGAKYAGDASLAGHTVALHSLTFSGKDGQKVEIPLGGKASATYGPGNPFAKKALAARAKADRLSGRRSAHDEGMREAFPLGAGYGRKGGEKRIDRTIKQAKETVEAIKNAERLEAQARAFDAGMIDAQGRHRDAASDARSDKAAVARETRTAKIDAAKAQLEGKEQWQVPGSVYATAHGYLAGSGRNLVLSGHDDTVKAALAEGKAVPAEVLAEYPHFGEDGSPRAAASAPAAPAPLVLSHPDLAAEFDTPAIRALDAKAAAIPRTDAIDTPERNQWRAHWIDQLAHFTTAEKVAHLVLGLPGSGKSSVIAAPLVESSGGAYLDNDRVKAAAPEWAGGLGGTALHPESVAIRLRALERVLARGGNLVFSTVGDEVHTPELARQLLAHGYTVHAHLADVPPDVSARRVLAGVEAGTRHFVSLRVILERGDQPRRGYAALAALDGVIAHAPLDNDVPKGTHPRPVADWRQRWGFADEPTGGPPALRSGDGPDGGRLDRGAAGSAPDAAHDEPVTDRPARPRRGGPLYSPAEPPPRGQYEAAVAGWWERQSPVERRKFILRGNEVYPSTPMSVALADVQYEQLPTPLQERIGIGYVQSRTGGPPAHPPRRPAKSPATSDALHRSLDALDSDVGAAGAHLEELAATIQRERAAFDRQDRKASLRVERGGADPVASLFSPAAPGTPLGAAVAQATGQPTTGPAAVRAAQEVKSLADDRAHLGPARRRPGAAGPLPRRARRARGVFFPDRAKSPASCATTGSTRSRTRSGTTSRRSTCATRRAKGAGSGAPSPHDRDEARARADGRDLYGSRKPNGGYGEEGIAQWARFYVTDPAKLQATRRSSPRGWSRTCSPRSPRSRRRSTRRAPTSPTTGRPATARVDAMIDVNPKRRFLPTTRTLATMLDDLHEIRARSTSAARHEPGAERLPPRPPHAWRRRDGRGDDRARHHRPDDGQRVTKGIAEVLAKALKPADVQRFRRYLVAERALELAGRGIDSGITVADAKDVVARYEQRSSSRSPRSCGRSRTR
jgi:2'-5' RNA ligase